MIKGVQPRGVLKHLTESDLCDHVGGLHLPKEIPRMIVRLIVRDIIPAYLDKEFCWSVQRDIEDNLIIRA